MKYKIKVGEKYLIGENPKETLKGTVAGDTTAVFSRVVKEMSAEMTEYQRIEELPAADVVEVVRCRDCKHYKESKLLGPTKFCYFYKIGTGLNTADDDFCSKGERREPNLDTTKGDNHD